MERTRSVPRPRRAAARGLVLVLAGLAACSSSAPRTGEIVDLVRHERFDEALRAAEELAEARPKDPEAQAVLRRARVVRLLAHGRAELFAGRPEAALESFVAARAIEPGNEVVADWVLKTERRLADRWLDVALDRSGGGDLEHTLEAYEKALEYVPDQPQALAGVARTIFLMNYREGVGREYYDAGLEALHEHMLPTAASRFGNAARYSADGERAAMRREDVRRQLAQERLVVARRFESENLFGAAMNEYRLVLLLDPTVEEASLGRDRMEREVQVQGLLAQADKRLRQGDLDEALALLDDAALRTRLQGDAVSKLRSDVERKRYDEMYEHALALERDFRYEEAVVAFQELLDAAGWHEDAADRQRTLEDYVQRAAELYERALVTEDPAERELLLREITTFWPEYRDVRERIAALEGVEGS